MQIEAVLPMFAKSRGLRVIHQEKVRAAGGLTPATKPDNVLVRHDMSDEEFRAFAKNSITNLDREIMAIFEVKTGLGKSARDGMTTDQKAYVAELTEAGKAEVYVLYFMPQNQIRPEFLSKQVEDFLLRNGAELSDDDVRIIRRLSLEMQRANAPETPFWTMFGLTLQASATALGLQVIANEDEDEE